MFERVHGLGIDFRTVRYALKLRALRLVAAELQRPDPAFLEQILPAAFKITLAPGEKKVQDLRISGGL